MQKQNYSSLSPIRSLSLKQNKLTQHRCPVVFPTPINGPKTKSSGRSVAQIQRASYFNSKLKDIEQGGIDVDKKGIKTLYIQSERSKSHIQVYQEINEKFWNQTKDNLKKIRLAGLMDDTHSLNPYLVDINDLNINVIENQEKKLKERKLKKEHKQNIQEKKLEIERKYRMLLGVDELGHRIEEKVPEITNAVRPEDYGEPETYMKYLKNRIFKTRKLQLLTIQRDHQRKQSLFEAHLIQEQQRNQLKKQQVVEPVVKLSKIAQFANKSNIKLEPLNSGDQTPLLAIPLKSNKLKLDDQKYFTERQNLYQNNNQSVATFYSEYPTMKTGLFELPRSTSIDLKKLPIQTNSTLQRFKSQESLEWAKSISADQTYRETESTLTKNIRKGKITFLNIDSNKKSLTSKPMTKQQSAEKSSTSLISQSTSKTKFKDKLRTSSDNTEGIKEMQNLQNSLSDDKILTKTQMLPALINIVKECLAENKDFREYLNELKKSQFIDQIEYRQYRHLLKVLETIDESKPEFLKLLLTNIQSSDLALTETKREVKNQHQDDLKGQLIKMLVRLKDTLKEKKK